MTPAEMFAEVESGDGWVTGALDLQWKVRDRTLYLQATRSRRDWGVNVMALPVPADESGPCAAHLGFTLLYGANAAALQSLDFDSVMGYSLGAAVGLRVHSDRLRLSGTAPETHLFGCPATYRGLSEVQRGLWRGVTRYECPGDLAAACLTWLGYEHAGRAVVLGGRSERVRGVPLSRWLSHHSPEEYMQRLLTGGA